MKNFWRILLNLLIVIMLIVLVGRFLVPVRPLTDTVPPDQLADPDSQFIEVDGLTVHFKTMGQGAPVFVLLHGFGASMFSWHAVMESFSQIGRVIAYDRTAFGLSERPMAWSGQNPFSSQSSVKLLLGILDHFSIQKAIMVGISAGGTIAMQFTLQHPERVQALVLVDPAVYESGGGPSWIRPFFRSPQMDHLRLLIVRSVQSKGLDLINLTWYDPMKITPEILAGYSKPHHADNWDQALWFFIVSSQPSNLTEHLCEFSLPILVISGDNDKIVPTGSSIRFAEELTNVKLVIIPQAGHVPQEEQPGLFMQAVEEFLEVF